MSGGPWSRPVADVPDALEHIAAEVHHVWQMEAQRRGMETSGRLWSQMPADYRAVMRDTLTVLFDRGTIARNWWR